jgi:hypothetical protein
MRPSTTSSTARESVTIVMTTSLRDATCDADSPAAAPAATSDAMASLRRAHTVTAKPCFNRFRTIGVPIVPSPMNPSATAID